MTVQDTERTAFTDQWEEWHTAREAALADPHGFLAVTGLYWLDDQPTRFPDAPGAWSPPATAWWSNSPRGKSWSSTAPGSRGRHDFGVLPERASVYATAGDAVIEVAKRGGHDIVRPRHPDNALRARPTPAPPPTPPTRAGRSPAAIVPFDEPRPTTVGAAVEGLQHVYDAPGQVEFELDGSHPPPDRVQRRRARQPARAVHRRHLRQSPPTPPTAPCPCAAPDAGGTVLIDFNRATNLPCAYTDLATCPLPPAGNRLPVAVEAGERIPHERLAAS